MGADILTRPITETEYDTDPDAAPPDPPDHEPFSHIVKKDDIAASMWSDDLITALCGHRFKPRMFNAPNLPICEACARIFAQGTS